MATRSDIIHKIKYQARLLYNGKRQGQYIYALSMADALLDAKQTAADMIAADPGRYPDGEAWIVEVRR